MGSMMASRVLALRQDLQRFTGFVRRETIGGVGHNIPQEAPHVFASAILSLTAHA